MSILLRLFEKLPFVRTLAAERNALRTGLNELSNEYSRTSESLRSELRMVADERDRFKTGFAPGHYYSPVPDLRELRAREADVFDRKTAAIPGIDLNAAGQRELLEALASFYPELPFAEQKRPGLRYYYENPNFSYCDAVILYGMIRHLRPRRLVEIGCGFSSCVSLDTNDRFLNGAMQCTFIDPFPQLLQALLFPGDFDQIRIIQDGVQNVPLGVFGELEENDILFVDSSHVLKTGGDLNTILFQVLPSLRAGVCVHFHDTPFPFEYPREWVFGGRAWNESYALRAFLQYNDAFRIVYFNTYLTETHRDFFERCMPLCLRNEGASLWLRKTQGATPGIEPMGMRAPFAPPRRFDAVYIDHPQQLGRGWYDCDKDLAGRWMGGFAEVVMRGPERPDQQIVLQGYQPNPAGVTLKLSAGEVSIGEFRLPEGRFKVSRPMPAELLNRERFVLRLQLDKTYRPPQDERDLGLSFGVIEVD